MLDKSFVFQSFVWTLRSQRMRKMMIWFGENIDPLMYWLYCQNYMKVQWIISCSNILKQISRILGEHIAVKFHYWKQLMIGNMNWTKIVQPELLSWTCQKLSTVKPRIIDCQISCKGTTNSLKTGNYRELVHIITKRVHVPQGPILESLLFDMIYL